MAVSSTQTWTMTIDDIVDEAQQRVGGELSTGYDAKRAVRALNLLQQEFTTRGINLWRVEETTLNLTIGLAAHTLDANVVDLIKFSTVIRDTSQTPVFDLMIPRIAIDEYYPLPNKEATGKPVQFWLDRQRVAPIIYVWPVPDVSTYQFRSMAIKKFYDAGPLSGDMDIPTRWLPPTISGLAWMLARGMPQKIDANRRNELLDEFERDYAFAAKEDRDTSGLRVTPDLSVYARCPT